MTSQTIHASQSGTFPLGGDLPIHRLGFGLHPDAPSDLEPEDLRLVVDCPFCGRPVPYPGPAGDGSPALAECADPRCDVYFDFALADVYAVCS